MRSLDLGPPKQRLLLAVLVCHLGNTVRVPTLIHALWGDDPPRSARENLRFYVHRLRKVLGPETVRRRGRAGYALVCDPESVDAHRFTGLVRRGEAALTDGEATTARRLLAAALNLWRGTPFADVDESAVLQKEAERLEEYRLSAVERYVDAEIQTGSGAAVIAELRSLVAAHPYRERYWGQLMTALCRAGRRAEALAAFRDARAVLVGDLGVDPGAELTDVHLAILRGGS